MDVRFSERRLNLLRRHLCPDDRDKAILDSFQQQTCDASSSAGRCPVVIGSMVLDIHATPASKELLPGTTTPGKVHYIKGGVARNVAECMRKLGISPFLISVVGQDMAGDILLKHWHSLGLPIEGIRHCRGVATPAVSAIFNANGELAGAVADTDVLELYLTPEWINQFDNVIRSAAFLMVDANLSAAALEAACKIAKEAQVPVWFEPVSVSKSVRYKAISNHITFASPNEAELVAMADSIKAPDSYTLNTLKDDGSISMVHALIKMLQPYISCLLQRGIAHVIVTLGKHGVILCSHMSELVSSLREVHISTGSADSKAARDAGVREGFQVDVKELESLSATDIGLTDVASDCSTSATSKLTDVAYVHFPALPASVVSLSGAGDCFVAGVLYALCLHKALPVSIAHGVAVARQAVQSQLNVPSELPGTCLTVDVEAVLASAQQILLH